MKSLAAYQNYRKYLKDLFDTKVGRFTERGAKTRFSEAIGCQSAHLSRVLKEEMHLTLEQAEATSLFLSHTSDEAEYFLMLVHSERAGTAALKKYYQGHMAAARGRLSNLTHRIPENVAISEQDCAWYFGSWIYVAIHVLASIPSMQTEAALSRGLGLHEETIREAVARLVEARLLGRVGPRLKIGTRRIHLGGESRFVWRHHMNWRLKAMHSLDTPGAKDELHYSSVVSVSQSDAVALRGMLVEAIERFNATVADSKDECAQALVIDFFKLA